MKRIIFTLLMIVASLSLTHAQCYIGYRDNNYAYIGYTIHNTWQLQLDHSLFVENIKYQYLRCSAGYVLEKNQFEMAASIYGGGTYCNSFHDLGSRLYGSYKPLNSFDIYAVINPHYDDHYKYNTCYQLGGSYRLNQEVTLFAHYTTIPEYRLSEKRVRMGLNLKVMHLQVSPQLSIPTQGNQSKTLRFLCEFRYEISKSK